MLDFDGIGRWWRGLAFWDAVWLFPVAFSLHVLEEWRQFTPWAVRYASEQFTRAEYVRIHLAGVATAILFALLLRFIRHPAVVFVFFAFVFTPTVFFNVLFHAGATATTGVYCPGLLTALTIYPPLYVRIGQLAAREGLLSRRAGIAAFVVAGIFHAAEVGHNVFKAW